MLSHPFRGAREGTEPPWSSELRASPALPNPQCGSSGCLHEGLTLVPRDPSPKAAQPLPGTQTPSQAVTWSSVLEKSQAEAPGRGPREASLPLAIGSLFTLFRAHQGLEDRQFLPGARHGQASTP